jgi:hypothetical protein
VWWSKTSLVEAIFDLPFGGLRATLQAPLDSIAAPASNDYAAAEQNSKFTWLHAPAANFVSADADFGNWIVSPRVGEMV